MPTAGAFYMHDDRFQDQENGIHGRQREFFGGRKLWYPKDDRVWVHDRFDEMNFHDVQHDHARRRPRETLRAWDGGTIHGVDHGYFDGTKSQYYYRDDSEDYKYVPKDSDTRYHSTKNYNGFPEERNTSYANAKNYRSVPTKFHSYYDDTKNFDNVQRESCAYYGNAKGYNNAPNVYSGRASRPYQPHCKNTFEISSVQNNSETYSRSQNEKASYNADMGKHSSEILSFQHEHTLPWKRTFAPILNSTSPPLYPSRSFRQELPFIQRGKACPENFTKLFSTSVRMAHSSLKPQPHPILRVKAFVPSGGHGNAVQCPFSLHSSIEGMPSPALHSSVSTTNNYSQYSKSRDQGRGLNISDPTNNKFSSSASQATRSYTQSHNAVYRQMSVQQPVQPTPKTSTPIFFQKFASTNKIQSHPQTTPTSSTVDAETSTPRGSNNSVAPSAEGQSDKEEAEGASFPYGGDHVLGVTGARGLTLGDQGFTGTPALLPVTQFSGQHPRGPGISSIGMALPGFVAPQQLGGNSEMSQMTWLPILTGATGAHGATYSPPYFGSYYPQPSEFSSSSVSPSYMCISCSGSLSSEV